MAELQEIPWELQQHEAHKRIAAYLTKGHKATEFLSPMFLRRFPGIMDSQFSVDWDTISGVFEWSPTFPVTLIDVGILDDWYSNPSVWDVPPKQQHPRCMLVLVRYTLPKGSDRKSAMVIGASFVFIPSRQARTTLCDALQFLKLSKRDSVVLVSMPANPTLSPELPD